MTSSKRKRGITICLILGLIIAVTIVVDIRAVAPKWTIYAEFFGVVCAAFAAWLYYNEKSSDS